MLVIVPGVLVVLLGACTATTHTPQAAPSAPRTPAQPTSPAAPARTARPGAVTLAFAGDVNFAGRTARLLRDPATAFGPISSVLRAADFTALNLETAVTSRGTPQPKTYHFRTTPAAFTALRDAGVDLVTMANNHVLDYGQAGLADTLAAAQAAPGSPTWGSGATPPRPGRRTSPRSTATRIAVIGVSQVAELASSWVATRTRPGEANAINLRRTLAAVRAARRLARVVIVFMHWGTEGEACPDPSQLALAPTAGRRRGQHHCRRARARAAGLRLARAHLRRLRHGQLPVVGALLQHGHRGAGTHPAPARAADRAVHPGDRVPHRPAHRDRGARARRAPAYYASLRGCAELAAHPS